MKTHLTAFFSKAALMCVAIAGMSSCQKIANNLKYDLNLQTATVNFTIPPCPNTSIEVAGSQTNYYNIDSFIRASTVNTMGVSNITSAKIKSCTITILDPKTAINFANFISCSGSFYSDGNKTPFGVTVNNNPDVYATELKLPVDTSAELKGYLNNSKQFTYTLRGNLRRPTTDSIHCTATFAFNVHVQGL